MSNTRTEVFIPRSTAGDDPNFFVAVNGESYLLPRGKSSKLPPAAAAEVLRAQRAQEALDQHMDELLRSARTGA